MEPAQKTFNADWEREARNWIAWARTPGHDSYWAFSPAFFEIVPAPGRATLEIGCGEGRVARDLARRGHRVSGIDASPTLIEAAREADPDGDYRVADAGALPFDAGTFDLVVAYNSLMDIEDMAGAVREAARVLTDGGCLCICLLHPMASAGRFESRAPEAPFVIASSYLESRRIVEQFERDGLKITFHYWCRPLEAYTRALEEAGLTLECLREPAQPPVAVDGNVVEARWRRLPLFLFLRAVKAR